MWPSLKKKKDAVLNWANGLKSIRDREEKANRGTHVWSSVLHYLKETKRVKHF